MIDEFIYRMDDRPISIKDCNSADLTWVELTELYFNYLQARGYILTREQVAEEVMLIFGER